MADLCSRRIGGCSLSQKGSDQSYIHPQITWDTGEKTELDWTHPKTGDHRCRVLQAKL